MLQWMLTWLRPEKTDRLFRIMEWIGLGLCVLFLPGLYGAWTVPADYQQGQAFRIMFCHVPCAVLSLACFVSMAIASFIYLVWRVRLYDFIAQGAAASGIFMCVAALVSGMIWGKPIWGTYWIWDARLTSEFILLCLYLCYLLLRHGTLNTRKARFMAAVFALVAVLDVPVVHYSVTWWFSLHQGSSFTRLSEKTIPWQMAWPMIWMMLAWIGYALVITTWRARTLWWRDRHQRHFVGAKHVS